MVKYFMVGEGEPIFIEKFFIAGMYIIFLLMGLDLGPVRPQRSKGYPSRTWFRDAF